MAGAHQAAVFVVGLPSQLVGKLSRVAGSNMALHIEVIKHKSVRTGQLELQNMPNVVSDQLEAAYSSAPSGDLRVLVLPYARVPAKVQETLEDLAKLGVPVTFAQANSDGWPGQLRERRVDKSFLDGLSARLSEEFTAGPTPPSSDVELELLRGLFAHDKLGENNHSSEQDLWKNRGRNLGSSAKRRILRDLCAEGILGWKPNKSAGGTGRVYWVADVRGALRRHPELQRYLKS